MPAADSPTPICPKCGSPRAIRVRRTGLLQKLVLHRFGMYPWECGGCRRVFLFKSRGPLRRRRRTTGEVHLPPAA